MAGKGSPKKSKGAVKQSINFKTLAYDVLAFTLYVCGVPDNKLKITIDIRNKYSVFELIGIYAGVLSTAFSSRDKWKLMFESRQNSSGLDNKEKIQAFLSEMVRTLPQFKAEDSIKIFATLALYSELMLFLNFQNIEFDFEHFLNMWSSYVTDTISLNKNEDELFKSLLFEHSNVEVYLNLIGRFIEDTAGSYGEKGVSEEFDTFSKVLQDFTKDGNSLADSIEERIMSRLGFMPHIPLPEDVEKTVSLLLPILDRDTDLPGNRDSSPEAPRFPLGFRSPFSEFTGVENILEHLNIISQSPRRDAPTKRRTKSKKKRC